MSIVEGRAGLVQDAADDSKSRYGLEKHGEGSSQSDLGFLLYREGITIGNVCGGQMRKYIILEVQETLFIHKHRDRKIFPKYFVGNFLFAVARDKLCVQLSEAVGQLQQSPLLWWNVLLGCFHKTHLPGNTGTSISSFPLSVFVGRVFFVLMERGTFFLFLILLLSLKFKHTKKNLVVARFLQERQGTDSFSDA